MALMPSVGAPPSVLPSCSLLLLLALALLQRPCLAVRALLSARPWIPEDILSAATVEGEPHGETVLLIGYGSLLSETSARITFPMLTGFRLARVHGYRRVFRHPSGVFFHRGVVPNGTLEMASLSVERCDECSIVVAIMGIPKEDLVGLLEREEEYGFVPTPFYDIHAAKGDKTLGHGIMCVPMERDEAFIERWGQERFQRSYAQHGIKTIWGWGPDSGILPCPIYLRHCVLAARKAGEDVLNSFLDDTFLVDRNTSIRQYLQLRPKLMTMLPPDPLVGRYSG